MSISSADLLFGFFLLCWGGFVGGAALICWKCNKEYPTCEHGKGKRIPRTLEEVRITENA